MAVDPKKLSTLISGVSLIALDPALGGRGLALSKILGLVALAIDTKDNADEKLDELNTEVQKVVSENRVPTHEEWNGLTSHSDVAHGVLQSWTRTPPPSGNDPPGTEETSSSSRKAAHPKDDSEPSGRSAKK